MINDNYLGVLIVCLCIILHYYILVVQASGPRKDIFTEEFMEQNFGYEHRTVFNEKIQKGGYPDCGSGRYTMKAGYGAWMNFNAAQRGHLNYAENISQILTMFLTCGLYFPVATTGIGAIYFLARVMYAVGYKLAGPKGRIYAVPIILFTQFFMPVFTIVSLGFLGTVGFRN